MSVALTRVCRRAELLRQWKAEPVPTVPEEPRSNAARVKRKPRKKPAEKRQIAVLALPFPMSCRFCRRGIQHEAHVWGCQAYKRHRNRRARLVAGHERREALSRVA